MCIVEIKTADNRKLTCFVSCSRQVASSGEANCSGVIRTRRSTVISPNSTCRKSTCKRKKGRKLLTTKDCLCEGGRREGGRRDDTVVRACAWVLVRVVCYTAVFVSSRNAPPGRSIAWRLCSRLESQRQTHFLIEFVVGSLLWGLFLENPGDFPGLKSDIQIKTLRIKTWFLANKPVHFVLLNDSLSCYLQNYWKLDLEHKQELSGPYRPQLRELFSRNSKFSIPSNANMYKGQFDLDSASD